MYLDHDKTFNVSYAVTFASSAMRDGLGHVSVITLFAVVAMSSRCVVATVEADATAPPA